MPTNTDRRASSAAYCALHMQYIASPFKTLGRIFSYVSVRRVSREDAGDLAGWLEKYTSDVKALRSEDTKLSFHTRAEGSGTIAG